jgi:outer membrane protein assembly factor BamB
MTRFLVVALLALSLQACSTLDALNPFSSSGKAKMAELQPFTPGAEARVVWRESVGKGDLYVLTPAVVGSTVYAAGKNGSLIRVDDGKLTWKIDTEQQLSGGVGANSAMVVVGSPKGELLAFASADGKLLWKANATSEILSPPVVGNGIVVVRSGDNRLAAYDSGTGNRKWIYQRPTPALSLRVTASPVLDGKYVFVGFPGGKLIALSVDNGAAVWEGTVALPKGATELDRVADITSSPIIAERMICAVAFQGRVACFDLGNGNLLWAREMSSSVGLSSDSRYVYVTDDKGAVHALDKASGASIWKQDKLFLRRVSAPLAYGKMIVVADIQGVLHFLSRDDGSFVARMTTDGSPVVAPLQTLGGNVLVQTSKGSVYAIEAQ